MGLDDSETVRCMLDELVCFFFLYKFSFGLFTYTAIYIYIYFQQQLVISSNTSNREHYQYNRVDIF